MSLLIAVLLSIPIEWQAPPGCPSPDEARSQLGAEADANEGIEHVAVTIVATEGGFEMRVEVGGSGDPVTRTIPLESCAQAVDAAAIVVSLATSPEPSVLPEPEPEPEPAILPEPPRLPDPEPPQIQDLRAQPPQGPSPLVEAEPDDPPEPRLPWVVEGAAGLRVRGLPSIGAFVRAGGGLTGRLWLARISVEHWIRNDESVPAPPDAALRTSMTSARLEGGVRIPAGPVSVPITGFVGAGLLVARGIDVPQPTTALEGIALGGLRAGLVLPVAERAAITLGAEAAFVFPRQSFSLDDGVALGTVGGFAGLFTAGFAFGPGAR